MNTFTVVPLVGTWIETYRSRNFSIAVNVVPLVGTWIETRTCHKKLFEKCIVVPLVGTWIETIV